MTSPIFTIFTSSHLYTIWECHRVGRWGIECWYPTAVRQGVTWRDELSELLPTCDLRVNPKYLLPQWFRRPDQLADPCIACASLPEWVSQQLAGGPLVRSSQPETTPELLFCRVTPSVWAWVRRANRAAGPGKLLGFQSECCNDLIPAYVAKAFGAEEIERETTLAEAHLAAGRPPRELLPQPDPEWRDLVRYGLLPRWHGYEAWASQTAPPLASPPPPSPARPLLAVRPAKPDKPALF